MNDLLWYNTPAKEWNEGLPIGNGRLAAMVLGDPNKERIALNHEWLWRGKHKDRDNEKNSIHLKEVRELLLDEKYDEGSIIANKYFGGKGGVSDQPSRIGSSRI